MAVTDLPGTRQVIAPAGYLARRREIFARIRAERTSVMAYLADEFDDERAYRDRAGEVREVVLVLGSPRGGTSVFRQVLAAADGALALPGEHRLLFTLLGLNFPDHGRADECATGADGVVLTPAERAFVLDNMLFECRGRDIPEPSAREWERFAWDWALRLRLQWPELEVPIESLVGWVRDGLTGSEGEPTIRVVRALRARGLPVNPYHYDLDPAVVAEAFPGVPVPTGPPSPVIIEITPYLALRPQRRPRVDTSRPTLVLKASSDAYRIPLVHDLFSGMRLRELHLTRNPVASVNGLIDGWDHHCFWQHDLAAAGFALPPPARPDWNFDLCADWPALACGSLVRLCTWQWLDPHERILRDAPHAVRLAFESFQAGGAQRHRLLADAVRDTGLRIGPRMRAQLERPPAVNRTAAPALARWRRLRPALAEVVAVPEIADMCRRLGYAVADVATWP